MQSSARNPAWLLLPCVLLAISCSSGPEEEIDLDEGDPIVFGEPPVVVEDHTFDADHVVQVALTMDPDGWDALRNQSRSFFSEFEGDCRAQPFQSPYTYFHATIEMDGESLPDIGIRKKGFIGSQSTEKPGFRINLDEYVVGAELFGNDNVTLNNSVQDPSLIRQCLVYQLFSAAGQPAPRCNFAHVSMNGNDLGIYVHVEPVKRSMLRDRFGNDDGDLYEGTISDFLPGWFRTFEPKNDDTDTSLAVIEQITDALDRGEPIQEVLETYFDVDSLISHLAMETITGHWDGYAGNRNNFYIYLDPSTEKFVFIPWGTDGTLRAGRVAEAPYGKGALSIYILRDPDLSDTFATRVRELLDEVWDEVALNAEVNRIVALLEVEIDLEPHQEPIEGVREFIDGRKAALTAKLPGQPGELEPAFCLQENGSITATFETTWGSLGTDLTQNGTLDLSIEWEDGPVEYVRAGVGAGYSEEGEPIVVMAALVDEANATLILPYIVFNPDAVSPGTSIPIGLFDGGSANGAVLYRSRETGGEFVQAGFLNGGALTFDVFGMVAGDAVQGSVSSSIYNWSEVSP